jgi:hypothetical protein
VKHFLPYLLKSHTKVIVPHPSIRKLVVQKDLGDKRENWMTTLQEYDLEIKPTKIVRGQGLCKLVVDSENSQVSDQEGWENELEVSNEVLYIPTPTFSWYNDIKYYLTHGSSPESLEPKKEKRFKVKINQI